MHGTVRRLSGGLAVVADEYEHLDASVVLIHDHLIHSLVRVQDDAQLQASGFTLAASEACARSKDRKQQPEVGS